MSDCGCTEPISDLDERLDELVFAMAQWPAMEELVHVSEHYEAIWASVDVNHPGAADAIAAVNIWQALARVATEIQKLKEMRNGNQD